MVRAESPATAERGICIEAIEHEAAVVTLIPHATFQHGRLDLIPPMVPFLDHIDVSALFNL